MNVLSLENLPGAVSELNKKTEWIIDALNQLIQAKPKINDRKTAKEAADYLNIALPTLYAHTSQRKIKHFKAGKKLLFYVEDLNDFLKAGRIATADEMAADTLTKRKGAKA